MQCGFNAVYGVSHLAVCSSYKFSVRKNIFFYFYIHNKHCNIVESHHIYHANDTKNFEDGKTFCDIFFLQ